MQAVKTIGLDIAKSGFQVHGVDADGQVVFRRQLKRRNVLAFFPKMKFRSEPTQQEMRL
jgi:transposase